MKAFVNPKGYVFRNGLMIYYSVGSFEHFYQKVFMDNIKYFHRVIDPAHILGTENFYYAKYWIIKGVTLQKFSKIP